MYFILDYISANVSILIILLLISNFALIITCIVLNSKSKKLSEKYNFFMGNVNEDNVSVEKLLDYYINEVRSISSEHGEILSSFRKIENELSNCFQKIGMVRYNPFDEMGGNLCFAVAILDKNNNGVVFNGIHNRSGSYTYAKPVENGESTFPLSDEEIQAIDIAKKK